MGQRAERRDGQRVDLSVAAHVVPLDVVELRRVPERRVAPVQAAHPPVQRRVPRADVPDVALEVLDVDGVEADDGHVQAHVDLGQRLAEPVGPVPLLGEVLLSAVQGREEGDHVALVGLVGGGEPGLVDAVVDAFVDPGVGLLDVLLQLLGVQGDGTVLFLNEVVKL